MGFSEDRSGLVFTREHGTPGHPQSLSGAFEHQLRRATLPVIRL